MANVTRSTRKLKEDDINSNRRNTGDKGSSASGSSNSDTSGLRRSARETPVKKQIASSPISTRRSERIEKRTPLTPPTTRKSERVEKQRMPSPLRRSERCENRHLTSSSDSRKSEKRLDLSENRNKQKNTDNSENYIKVNTIDRSRYEKKDERPVHTVSRKKRMDARSYVKALLKPQPKKTPDLSKKLIECDEASQGDTVHMGSSSFKEAENVTEAGEGEDRDAEGSCDGLRNSEGGGSKNTEEMKLSHSSRKRKKLEDEFQDCTNSDSSPVSKCSKLESSPGVSAKEAVTDAVKVQLDGSIRDAILTVPMVSIPEGRSVSGDQCLEKEYNLGTPKKKRKLDELDSDVSMTATNEEIYSSADPVPALPSESKRASVLEGCDACSKRQRFGVDSQKCHMCSHNNVEHQRLCNKSSLEEVHEKGSIFENPDNGLMPMCSTIKDGIHTNVNHIDSSLQENVHRSEPLLDVERKDVSDGIESICDVREEEVPDCEGSQKQKQYLVKYKGLSHAHNCWVPEHQLLLESPFLVARFKKKQTLNWKLEWAKPHRLVRRRLLKQQDEICRDCQYEWFVKWTGLGYEHGTWELENAPSLRSTEAMKLKRDYESRLEKALSAANPSFEKLLEERKISAPKLSKLPSFNKSGLHNDHLNFVNKLREYWRKSQNAVVTEDQERILKVVLFILSMQSDVCRPFLIISTSHAISDWEAEFMRLAPSVNVVAYNGNKVVRETIRALEFYEDGGCVMLQVLISPIDAIIEDLEALELIGWEAIIVDECQRPRVSSHFEQIKKLTNGFRLLLLTGPIKDSIAEYLNHLSFIESGEISLKTDSGDTISNLKERFARFVVCERKSDSSKFVEYWVPVSLSNVQLEQYCATLLSNSISLCSCSKNDPVGALPDILVSVRKTCDHPYLVDPSLGSLLRKDLSKVESLNVEINASGKLQVLDKILSEIKKRGLRVLILFQSIGGSGRNNIGDILDDFLHERFGRDSFERVDSGLLSSRKQVALNNFNNKEERRFVFLIENRACLPSIKLSSVDMFIIFESDWNPLNDIRALQKISIDSQFKQLKVFRLYSSCTVEEKVLSLAKQDLTLDSNIQNLSRSTSHSLLLWGAKFLFHKLDEFHSDRTPSSVSKISSEQLFLNDLMQEVLSQLPNGAESTGKENCNIVLKAQQSGTSYSKDIKLPTEIEMQLTSEELPHVLWSNILNGRYPEWRYASEPSPRIRKRVQYFDESPKKPQENAEIVKKRKKVVSNIVDTNALKSGLDDKRKSVSMDKEGASDGPTGHGSPILLESTAKPNAVNHSVLDKPETHMVDSEQINNLRESQKSLHLSLKPVISKLCEMLQLPDNVKSLAGKFLEYMMNNHKIHMVPVALFQAFQISLCWSAASLLECKLDRKARRESLSLAKQHLNFECKEEEAQLVYSRLRDLKKQFCHQVRNGELVSAENHLPKGNEKNFDLGASQSSLSGPQELEDGEIRETPKSQKSSIQLDSSMEKQAADSENGSGSSNVGSLKNVKQVEKVHRWRMKKLYGKQGEEFEKFRKNKEKIVEKEHADLEVKHKLESALVRKLNSQMSVRLEKLKILDQDFARKKEEVNIRMEEQQKRLEAMQRMARDKEELLEKHWLQEAKSGRSVSRYATLPLSDSGSGVEIMADFEQVIVSHQSSGSAFTVENINGCEQGGAIPEETTTPSSKSLERQDTSGVVSVSHAEAVPSVICATTPEKEFMVAVTEALPLKHERVVETDTLVLESAADTKSKPERRLCRSDSGSSSLEQTSISPLLDQGNTAPAQDSQIPSFQVTVDEHAEPAGPELRDVEVSKCNVPNDSQVDIQAPQTADAVACNQVNDDTLVVVSDVQLQLSPVDSLSNEPTQSDVLACGRVDQEPNVSIQQFEAQIQSYEDQDAVIGVEVSNPNVSKESQVESQVPREVDSVLGNQVNDDTPIVPSAEQSQLSPVADTLFAESTQPDVQACARVDQEPNVLLQQVETQIRAPCIGQDPTNHHFEPVPDNHFGHAASEQTQTSTPLPDARSTEHSQVEVSASMCINQEQRNESQNSHKEFETQIQSPVEDQNEPLSHSDTLTGNQCRTSAAHPVPEVPPAMEQPTQDLLIDRPRLQPDSLFTHAHSRQVQDLAPSTDPPSTVCSQMEIPTVTCTDQMQRNGRQTVLQPSELQIGSPVENQNERYSHSDPCSSTPVPAQPPFLQQNELLNHSYPRPNAQPRQPVQPSATGIVSRLSDHRTMIYPDYSPLPLQSAPVSSQVSQQIFFDPLQNELLRIHKEEEQTFKMHEEEKMRISSECEKEVQEIRRKYNTVLQRAELEFVKKKNTLETNYRIVNLNRSLAEAFRLKCESRTAGLPGQQQGTPPGFMQQILHSSLPQAAQRPAPVPGPRTVPLPIRPVQMVHQPSALFSSNPIRSHFGQVRSPSGNHQIRTDVRAPAPHLQRFRPTTSMQAPSLSSLTCVLPGQQSLSNPSTSSSVHPQRTPRQPTPMPGPFSRTHQSENMGAFRSSHNSSLSALEHLMDIERHASPNPPNLLPPLQDLGQTTNKYNAAGLKITGGLREPSVHAGTAAGVVCLSDDD